MFPLFEDRHDAGKQLAAALARYRGRADVLVLGLPRGGVPVAYEVARALDAPLDVLVVRKLGVPGHEELAMGAIAHGGVRVLNQRAVDMLDIPESIIEAVARRELVELSRRERAFRGDRPPPALGGRTVIVVDDGLATGSTMHAAALAVRAEGPASVIVAVPVAAAETCALFRNIADEIVCLTTPEPFFGVGPWYRDFSQTTDDEVRALLAEGTRSRRRTDEARP